MNKRKAFNFFRSYWEVGQQLPDKERLKFYDALMLRQFEGIETELTGMANFAYVSQKFNIDSQVLGYCTKMKILPPTAPPTAPPTEGATEPPTVQEKGEEKGEVQYVEETTEVVDKKKQTFEEQVNAFLGWFNQMMLKRKGKLGRFNKLSKPDRNNFKEVRDAYEFKDFEIAFNNMYKNQWAHDTGNLTPTHFLKLSNFNRYLNQSSNYTPASKILDHD
jgi:hypothetical protein